MRVGSGMLCCRYGLTGLWTASVTYHILGVHTRAQRACMRQLSSAFGQLRRVQAPRSLAGAPVVAMLRARGIHSRNSSVAPEVAQILVPKHFTWPAESGVTDPSLQPANYKLTECFQLFAACA